MSFAKQLARLREAAAHRQPGINQDKAYVDRRDLQELLYDFDRIDTALRSLLPKNGSEGILLIAKERKRQIEKEGWTPEHDQQHIGEELVMAAICYTAPQDYKSEGVHTFWPWWKGYDRIPVGWKPTPNNRIRELQKAGALIAAEIDRLQRKGTE